MDLTSLLSYRPSLTDYLDGGKAGTSLFDGVSQSLNQKVEAAKAAAATNAALTGQGDNIALSEEAKALLAHGTGGQNENLTGTQKGAQNFMMGFFDQSGLDIAKLSDQVLDFIEGLGAVIAGSAATTRDIGTDSMEAQLSGGNRKSYTLTGTNTRLRISVDYVDGKPQKLSVTDITGGQVETAEIAIKSDDDGTQYLSVERTQREYRNGYMLALDPIEPLEMTLYQS